MNHSMKATICTQYGASDVLVIQDIAKPQPKEDEVLVKIMASSATAADSMMRQGTPKYGRLFLGLRKPKYPITGTGFSGIVEAVGPEVAEFKIGDEIFGESIFGTGTNAEYLCVSESVVVAHKPRNISFEEAAPICDGALTSLNMLQELAGIQPGQRVLINGASGSLGSSAVQLAKYFGAHVTAVCSGRNADWVSELGADQVIDYTQQDFCKFNYGNAPSLNGTGHAKGFDIIYDSIGSLKFDQCKPALTPKGVYVSPVLSMPVLLKMLTTAKSSGKKVKFGATGMLPVDKLKQLVNQLLPLFKQGHLKSVIDQAFPLTQIADAHHYVDTGRKKGNVVIVN